MDDCDRKVEVNKKRLEDNSEDYDASPEVCIPIFKMSVHTIFIFIIVHMLLIEAPIAIDLNLYIFDGHFVIFAS